MVAYEKTNILEDSYEEVESQCRSVEEIVYPKVMQNLKKEFVKIVNNEKYKQKLIETKCL